MSDEMFAHLSCCRSDPEHLRHLAASATEARLSGLLTDLRALADQLRGISKHELTVQDLDDLAARFTPDDPQENLHA